MYVYYLSHQHFIIPPMPTGLVIGMAFKLNIHANYLHYFEDVFSISFINNCLHIFKAPSTVLYKLIFSSLTGWSFFVVWNFSFIDIRNLVRRLFSSGNVHQCPWSVRPGGPGTFAVVFCVVRTPAVSTTVAATRPKAPKIFHNTTIFAPIVLSVATRHPSRILSTSSIVTFILSVT